MEHDAWLLCHRELVSLIVRFDASYDEDARERLLLILYGQGGYDKDAVDHARQMMRPKLLSKLDSVERSTYCGPREMRRS